jgi:ribosomal protein S2
MTSWACFLVKRFILTERSGIHIIDLQQSLSYIDKAYEYVRETVAHGGTVRVPPAGLVSEVDAAVEQLANGDDGHGRSPLFLG